MIRTQPTGHRSFRWRLGRWRSGRWRSFRWRSFRWRSGRWRSGRWFVLWVACHVSLNTITAAEVDFTRDIEPILETRCLGCHNDNVAKGSLSLTTPATLIENDWLTPGDASTSRLVDVITGEEPEMPHDGEPLTGEQRSTIADWVNAGADWPGSRVLRERSAAGRDWWSLRPIATAPPHPKIDGFINAGLAAAGLTGRPAADRRTWLRRVTVDLSGLPPTPEVVRRFVGDPHPAAHRRVVDRLLANPDYGIRWGRHWLDVVRFGESNGFERNVLIDGLWPFRDYVIDSLNDDKPFDRLTTEHLAGDAIDDELSGDNNAVIGSAFLVAGPYDDVGNQDPIAAQQIRVNTIDEMVRTTAEAFLGLTVGCARCHDHKFDPITQRDYYALQAVFGGVRHGAAVVQTADQRRRRTENEAGLKRQIAEVAASIAELRRAVEDRAVEDRAVEDQAGAGAAAIGGSWTRPPVDRRGTTEIFPPRTASAVRLICRSTDVSPTARTGFGIEELEVWSAGDQPVNVALASAGATAQGPARVAVDAPAAYAASLINDGKTGRTFIAASDRVTIHLARPRRIDRVIFSSARGLADPSHRRFLFVGEYDVQTSVDGEVWQTVASGDDRQPPTPAHARARCFDATIEPAERRRLVQLRATEKELNRQLTAMPAPPRVWIGNHVAADAAGPFHRLLGGSPTRPAEMVFPASPSTLPDLAASFTYDADQMGADPIGKSRRLALARWMTDPDNPLWRRVIVNRLWQHHFGHGIVPTPNDFGSMGGLPSHPKLLDHLARRLDRFGTRLKPLHREIVLSDAYRRGSDFDPAAASIDADSRLLWRYPPGRMDAESIRETMLATAGMLAREMGGPGFQLYRYQRDNVATYWPLDHHDASTYRRSVYHQNVRASRVDLISDFDQPDCAFSAGRRVATTTPTQALTGLNHSFTLDMAAALADRLVREAGPSIDDQIHHLFDLAFVRSPTAGELASVRPVARRHGMATVCRAVLNASELIYVR